MRSSLAWRSEALRIAGGRLVIASVALASGCVLPPLRADGGLSSDQRWTGRAGVHVEGARLDPGSLWDVGAGVVFNAPDGRQLTGTGGYLDAAWTPWLSEQLRLNVGPGLSLLDRDGHFDAVAYARASLERVWLVDLRDRVGFTRGQAALGAYLEISRPLGDREMAVVIGITGRSPVITGFSPF